MKFSYIPMLLLATFIGAALTACTSYEGPEPVGPNGSRWIGGPDGGAYILVRDDDNKNDNIYYAEIYYDYSKEVWYKGPLTLNTNKPFDVNNIDQISNWDGERLHLKNNSYFTSVSPVK